MTPAQRTEKALKRFIAALDQIEAAVERRAGNQSQLSNAREELAIMQDDRARLAAELDGALARNQALMLANDEAGQRLEVAKKAIRDVLGPSGGS